MKYLKQEITGFTTSNIPETTKPWDNSIVTAGAFVVGTRYIITTLGTTNFTLIGATTNTVGLAFVATGVGAGTGTTQETYVVGDYALQGVFIYKCVSANTDKSPELTLGIYWVKWVVSNRWAMLDVSSNSQSVVTGGDLVVTFPQQAMETLTIGNFEASGVKIEIIEANGTTVLWQYLDTDFYNIGVDDYYSYMYEPYNFSVPRGLKVDLPVKGSTIRVTLYSSGIRAACGFLVGGFPIYMGQTLFGVSFKYNSFALKSVDDFGTLTIVKRAVQDIVDFETIIPSSYLMTVRQNIKLTYNDIVVFIVEDASSNYENLITLGVIESASIVLQNAVQTTMSWAIVEAI